MSDTPRTDKLHGNTEDRAYPDMLDLARQLERELAAAQAAAPTSETNAQRTLRSSDAYCPNCGHNRDESAVSTVDHGEGIHACQMCGAVWRETNAAATPKELGNAHESKPDTSTPAAAPIEPNNIVFRSA